MKLQKEYTLINSQGLSYPSRTKGTIGGHRKLKIYGCLRLFVGLARVTIPNIASSLEIVLSLKKQVIALVKFATRGSEYGI
jgi:hypothetical protein